MYQEVIVDKFFNMSTKPKHFCSLAAKGIKPTAV